MSQPQVHTLNKENFSTFLEDEGIGEEQHVTFMAPLVAHDISQDLEAASHSANVDDGLVAIVW